MKRYLTRSLAAAALVLLASCGGDSEARLGNGQTVTLESYCATSGGLPAALRHTIVIVDASAVQQGEAGQLRRLNRSLFDLLVGLGGDPRQAVSSGAMAPRERLTILLAPVDGGAPQTLVTGCVPAFSAEELAALRAGRSGAANATSDFMGGGDRADVEKAARDFSDAVLGAIGKIGQVAGPPRNSSFAESALVRSLSNAPRISLPEQGVPRIFLFTDLTRLPSSPTVEETRTAGFAAAAQANINLGLAEVHMAGPTAPRSRLAREYAQAFVLASGGSLQGFGGAALNGLRGPPTIVEVYTGEIVFPVGRYPLRVRLARDRNGALVNSWVNVRADQDRSTPLDGNVICEEDSRCRIVSDGGFAQIWTLSPGGESEHDSATMSVAGLRNFNAELTDGRMTGAISDPSVDRIGSPGVDALRFTLTLQPDGLL